MAIMKKLLILLLFIPYFGFSQGIKVSALTEATTIGNTDLFLVVQGGATKKVQFFRLSYNADSAAYQIADSLNYYLTATQTRNAIHDSLNVFSVYSNNGLTKDVDTIKLGGSLNESTILNLGNYILSYEGNNEKLQLTKSKIRLIAYDSGNLKQNEVLIDSIKTIIRAVGETDTVNYNIDTTGIYYTNVIDTSNWTDNYFVSKRWVLDNNSNVTLGTNGQVPFMNVAGSDFSYDNVGTFQKVSNALYLDDGSANVFIGLGTAENITTAQNNTIFGNSAGSGLSSGTGNVLIGLGSGAFITTGLNNVVNGYQAGASLAGGNSNVISGFRAGYNITGDNNIVIGRQSGYNNEIGNSNIFIGYQAGYNDTTSNKLYIENSNSATPLIYGDFANDTVRINGTLDVTKNLSVDTITTEFVYLKTKSHGFFAFEDSAIVIDCTQDVWVQVTNATNTLFTAIQEGEGFDISGDTIFFNADAKAGLTPHVIFEWGINGFAGNAEDYEVRIYNIDDTDGIVRKDEGSSTGANNIISIGTTSYDINSSFGDRYILQIMNKTNSGDFTIENGSIYLEVSHY